MRDAGIRNDESMMFKNYFLQMNSLVVNFCSSSQKNRIISESFQKLRSL